MYFAVTYHHLLNPVIGEGFFTLEEAGYQARELSLQMRVCWELFPGVLGIRYRALRLHVQPVSEVL
jgi:hypothetical protein